MRRVISHAETITTTTIVTTSNSTPFKVADAKIIALQSVITVNTPAAKTFVAGTSEVQTITTPSLIASADGDFCILTDGSGVKWGFYLDKTGLGSTIPTGVAYTSLAAGKKTAVDISLTTTATDVANAVRTALNALTGFTAAITLSGSATVIATMVVRGPCAVPVVKAFDGVAAATVLAGVETTPGIASTVVIATDRITITAHGLTTGLKGQASSGGTLPAGLAISTDYFVIVVDANIIKLATSLANALASTAIDITDQGTNAATHTFTPTAIAGGKITLQKSNCYDPIQNPSGAFDDVAAGTAITATADIWISDIDPGYTWARIQHTATAGQLSAATYVVVKSDCE